MTVEEMKERLHRDVRGCTSHCPICEVIDDFAHSRDSEEEADEEETPTPPVQITIPTIGTVLTLERGWTFPLYHEYRNEDFWKRVTKRDKWDGSGYGRTLDATEMTLPSGTKLVVDRIYIRKGKGEFDSITFRLKKGDVPGRKDIYGRFWAKLGDVNRVKCAWDQDTIKQTEANIIDSLADLVV